MSLEQYRPISGSAPFVTIDFPTLKISDEPIQIFKAEMKGFANNGYVLKLQILNANFNELQTLVSGDKYSNTYLSRVRKEAIPIDVIFYQGKSGSYPREKTRKIRAIITTMYSHGADQMDFVDIIAIDPLSWAMRTGDARGGVIVGNISSAMEQLIKLYAPSINLEIDESRDNKKNLWPLLRRHPNEIISHWINLASSLNTTETPWMIGINNYDVKIGPQTSFKSKTVGYYRKFSKEGDGEVRTWDAILNTCVGTYQMGLVTAGISSSTGKHIDQITNPELAIITDKNTQHKYVPKTPSSQYKAPIRPEDTFKPESYGMSYVESPPEYYGGNELGMQYSEYFDAYARTKYIRETYKMFMIDTVVTGHGYFDSTMGLGSNTVFLDWRNYFGKASETYYLHGNWLVCGFEHKYDSDQGWRTTLKLAKPDHNAVGTLVGEDVN